MASEAAPEPGGVKRGPGVRAPLTIGVAGGTGSGKTTVAEALAAAGHGQVLLLPQDAYYKALRDLPVEEPSQINYDEPEVFDTALLVEQLDYLVACYTVERPIYDFTRNDRSSATLSLSPAPVIVVEGILVLHAEELRRRLRLKVFVDAPADERFIRRLERDVRERGRSPQSVIQQYRRTVKPMHDLYIEPTKQHADLILPGGGRNEVAVEVLASYVRSFLGADGR